MEYTPFLLGVEARFNINERMSINGIYDCAVFEKDYDMNGQNDTDADYTAVRVKFNYLFTEQYGVSLGHRWSELKITDNGKKCDEGYTIGFDIYF